MREWIIGRNPIYEVLRAGRRQAFQILVVENTKKKDRLADILRLSAERKIPVKEVPRHDLDTHGKVHQGIALECSGYPYSALSNIHIRTQKRGEPPLILILDTLQDPQNLGTLLRTAEVVGVHGVLLPPRHSATVTPAVVSASSGACEHLLIAQTNLAQAIQQLKEQGVWILGLENSPEAGFPNQTRLDGPLALVVGNEHQGMRNLVRKSCDLLMRMPMRGKVESLNAATAGSVALYLVWQAREFTGIPPN
ncbi:MAG: 23S rRNA (guanosine(2251)-2'-O)-methyltransferase RlmB [Anaerolineales bacterium]|nr:23S rRNA (guanosine(2251)-2'-O)-methyltransferase RlmB [Anaerolineales bacterium]